MSVRPCVALFALMLGVAESSALAGADDTEDRWVDLPPLPTPRQEVGVTASEGGIWVIGGITGDRRASDVVERYLAEEAAWRSAPRLPESLHHVGAASVGAKIYAVGGLDGSFRGVDSVYVLARGDDRWTAVAPLPWPRGAMAVVALDERIWVAGGENRGSFADAAVYSPEDDVWVDLPSLPVARNHLAGAAAGGRFWAIGGRDRGLSGRVDVLDPAVGEWRSAPPLPTPRAGIAAAVVDGSIFVFGGEGNRASPTGVFGEVESFALAAGEWTRRPPMARPRHGIGAAVVGGLVHVPGGSPFEGFGVTSDHDALSPAEVDPAAPGFLRGDANRDGAVDIADAVRVLLHLFAGGPPLSCADAADVDDSGELEIADAVRLLSYLFRAGELPPAPGPFASGPDPTTDDLSCEPAAVHGFVGR